MEILTSIREILAPGDTELKGKKAVIKKGTQTALLKGS